MNKELKEILKGFKHTLRILEKPEKVSLATASILMMIAGILTNLPALILGNLVDKIITADSVYFKIAIPSIAMIIGIIIFREVLTVLRKYLVENIATQTEKKQTVRTISHILRTDISTITSQQIGALNGRIFRSIQGLVKMIKLGFLDFLPVLFSALAAIGIALYQKPLLATIMILVIPAGLYIIVKQVSSQKGIRVALLRGKEKIDGAVVEMLGGLETVRVLNTVENEVTKVESVAENLRKKEMRHHISMAFFDSWKYLNEGFFYIVVMSISILLAANGMITEGDILVYSILFLSITQPLREIHRILDESHESSIRVNDLYELTKQPIDESFTEQTVNDVDETTTTSCVIKSQNLSFNYKDTAYIPVLQNINLCIKPGERIGIAGASGCGKSTLIKILLRLIHDYSGVVRLFGKDLRNIDREEIAQRIAYVPQHTYIFSGTVKENIVYGCTEKVSEKQIIKVAKEANIYEEIKNVLGGLEGQITENGSNLSGGQKQRLAITRLILKSPDILIFDEATSALDNTNETAIQENLEGLFRGRTVITIAHRLTTLKNSDRIFVFENGKVIQEGNYKTLAKQKGLFKEFLNQKMHKN